jgi:antitoxin MazE
MFVQVKKWGNSASIRIPAALMVSASLVLDQTVEIREEHGCLIIEPIVAPIFELDTMLAQMTPDTFHDDVDFGQPVGGEIW